MKEIKESAFGIGCAQERSDNFCDFINFCGTKEIKESAFGTCCAQERSDNFCDFFYFLRPFGSKRQSRALRDKINQQDKKNLLD
jgi:hypothetical protein